MGGGTKSFFDLGNMLKDRYDVIMCIPCGSDEIVNAAHEFNLKTYEVRTPIPSLNVYSGMTGYTSRYFVSRLFRFTKSKVLAEELESLKPDCIIFNTSVTAPLAHYINDSIKKICIVRETFIKSIFSPYIRKNFQKNFDGIGYIADHEKKFLKLKNVRQIIVPDSLSENKINFVDITTAKQHLNIDVSTFCVLFMGGLIEIKGLDVLLDSIEFLKGDFTFIIAGYIDRKIISRKYIWRHWYHLKYSSYLNRVRRKLKILENSGKLIITGYVTDISPYMLACDTVVFPSTAAHQPRPCIEAGIYKKSVVISDYEATREYFIDGYNALTFTPGSARQLANKLQKLKDDEELNRKLGINNEKMSLEFHNYKKIQEQLNNFIDDVIMN